MRYHKGILIVSLILAIVVALSPLLSSQFFGDKVFDSVFEKSLSSLPVLRAGRIMPVSSASADTLKSVSGKVSAKPFGKKVSSTKWLWLLNAQALKMGELPMLRTDNRELQNFLKSDGRYVSYDSVVENYDAIYNSAVSQDGGAYVSACSQLLNGALAYGLAVNTLCVKYPEVENASEFIKRWQKAVSDAEEELKESVSKKRNPNDEKLIVASSYLSYLHSLSEYEKQNNDIVIKAVVSNKGFETVADALLDRKASTQTQEIVSAYAEIADLIAKGDFRGVETPMLKVFDIFEQSGKVDFSRVRLENFFNAVNPFFAGLILYAIAFLLFVFSSLKGRALACSGMVFFAVAVVVNVLAIVARVYIQMRPPVTNFYSSVVFTGAAAALVGFVVYLKKQSLLSAISATFVGVLSLLVAVNLPYSGDTMGMMRAVLNSNFWLSAHVMTIMIGYCGLFLAGFMASFRLVANAFSKGNFGLETAKTADSVYLLLCGCLLFTFTGTMLGGIWADMSWGRFWGWDPKENGALMIVLWTAATIHCRALRVCNDRMFLVLTSLGNVVVAWAWFGVNLMGVGLHSYGFINGGWGWFFIFIILQILVAPFGFLVYKADNIILKK